MGLPSTWIFQQFCFCGSDRGKKRQLQAEKGVELVNMKDSSPVGTRSTFNVRRAAARPGAI